MGSKYQRYKHILVPLDGSEFAKRVLPDAFALAHLNQAEVTLLQVIVPMEHRLDPDVLDPDYIADKEAELKVLSRKSLRRVWRESEDCTNLTVHTVAECGRPGETIIEYAHQHPIDLIVMATHGRSGLARWTRGSVADKVLRGADTPILLVRVHSNQRSD